MAGRLPHRHAVAADKTGGLHKLLRCAAMPQIARCSMLESTASVPAILFASILGVIVFVAVSEVLLGPRR